MSSMEYAQDRMCKCGSDYGEHFSDLDGDDRCPTANKQTFEPMHTDEELANNG